MITFNIYLFVPLHPHLTQLPIIQTSQLCNCLILLTVQCQQSPKPTSYITPIHPMAMNFYLTILTNSILTFSIRCRFSDGQVHADDPLTTDASDTFSLLNGVWPPYIHTSSMSFFFTSICNRFVGGDPQPKQLLAKCATCMQFSKHHHFQVGVQWSIQCITWNKNGVRNLDTFWKGSESFIRKIRKREIDGEQQVIGVGDERNCWNLPQIQGP